MKRVLWFILLSAALALFIPFTSHGQGEYRYVTLKYDSIKTLRDFNDHLLLSRKLRWHLSTRNTATLEEEVLAKLDIIVEKAKTVLDMSPTNLNFSVVILPTKKDIARIYQDKYQEHIDHIAYYSLSEDTIYISAEDTRLSVIAHEIAHAIVDHYFKVRPPYKIHELMAQFAERHISD